MRKTSLLFCVALAGCHIGPEGGPDRTLASRIPADTMLLAGVRMDALRGTVLYQKVLEGRGLSEFDKLAGRASFDPRKDVKEMLFAFDGRSGVLLAKGRFGKPSIQDAEQAGHRGATLWGVQNWWVAFPDGETAVAGTREMVGRVLDGPGGGGKGLLERARKLPRAAQAWMVFDGGAFQANAAPDASNLSNFTRVFRSMTEASFYIEADKGLDGLLEGRCQNEKQARTLSDAVRGLVGIARLSVPSSHSEALRFYDGITVGQHDDELSIRIRVPEDALDAFLKFAVPPR